MRSILPFLILLSVFVTSCKDDEHEVRSYGLNAEATVPSGTERGTFVYRKTGAGAQTFVRRIAGTTAPGVSRLLASRLSAQTPEGTIPVVDEARNLWSAPGVIDDAVLEQYQYHEPIFLTNRSIEYRFPAGVGLPLAANETLDVAMFAENPTGAAIAVSASVVLHTSTEPVRHEAVPLYYFNPEVSLAPGSATQVRKTFPATEKMNVFMLTSFTNGYATAFVIRIAGGPRDNEVIYESTNMAAPEVITLDEPVVLNPGEGLMMDVTYSNPTTQQVNFGASSTQEFSGIFGYYYR